MARTLLIDWDQKRLTAMLDGVGKGAKCPCFSIATEMVPNPVMAEELGAYLKEQVKARGWQPAALVALIGRDRLVAREFRVPMIGPDEEPELIRLQTARELIDSADEVAIDYHAWNDEGDSSQRRVLALALRNELLDTYKKLAASVGLRLAGLMPRSAGLAALSEGDSPEVIVGLGHGWREIVLARSGQALLSRSLAGTGWAQEVRRVLASQGLTSPGAAKVRVAGGTAEDVAALAAVLDSPPSQEPMPPELDSAEAPWGSSAALVGVVRASGRKSRLPDFVNPKKAPPPSNAGARRLILGGVAAGLLLTFLVGLGWWKLSSREDEIAQMRQQLEVKKFENKRMAEDEKKLTALAAWETPVWLEELVDIACRIPDTRKLLVTEIITSPINTAGAGGPAASEFNSRMEIRGVFPEGTGDPKELDKIDAELRKAIPTRQYLSKVKKSGNQFTLDVQVRTRSATSYSLSPPAKPKDLEKSKEGAPKASKSASESEGAEDKKSSPKDGNKEGGQESKEVQGKSVPAGGADKKDMNKEAKGVAGGPKDGQ